jgi:beta-glucosidase
MPARTTAHRGVRRGTRLGARPAERGGIARGRLAAVAAVALVGLAWLATPSVALGARPDPRPGHPDACPFAVSPLEQERNATSLASQAVTLMTLPEKVAFLGLQPVPAARVEEENPGVPDLCIPPLLLRDGPVGVAAGATGVTAFPSELNVAATFDPPLAQRYGTDIGREGRGQGDMGIQGPGIDVSVFDNWGRGFENFGEDPDLTTVLGAAVVKGIQHTGEFAMAKHLGGYVEESNRAGVNVLLSPRANEEIYLAPFRAAAAAGVASVMCAMGSTNGLENCSSTAAIEELRTAGFHGFVRTDARASTDEVGALEAGVDLFRPYDPAPVQAALTSGTLPVTDVNRAVREVLAVMFAHGDAGASFANAGRLVTSANSLATSRSIAEQSTVLLKDDGILPLGTHATGSLAVIGAAAARDPVVAGGGSSQVTDPALVSDLAGLETLAPPRRTLYEPAATSVGQVPLPAGSPIPDPAAPGYEEAALELPPLMNGLVDFSYATLQPAQLRVDGAVLLQNYETSTTLPYTFERATELGPGPHTVMLAWRDGTAPPTVTAQPVDNLLARAATAARAARTAIVVVGEQDTEGVDRATLALPGYQDQLVEAVAAANPRTIVVVDSGGPVLMPWLSAVAAVVEAWYPGEVAGSALAAVLSGAVDPSGRLPVAFPTSDATAPMIPTSSWPTPPSTTDLITLGDLGVGSRWYAAHHVAPLFSFGYGLSYTSFTVRDVTVTVDGSRLAVRAAVTNTGHRLGRYVALADVTFPAAAGEPSRELKGFGAVTLAPGVRASLSISIPLRSLAVWQGSWARVAGRYTVSIGSHTASITLPAAS